MIHDSIPFYFTTGGTLSKEATSYVTRQADDDLYNALKQSEFCYVLTSRQMGKSSLMIRAAERLRQDQCAVVHIDLTQVGKSGVSALEFYDAIQIQLDDQLGLCGALDDFWQQSRFEPVQRFIQGLRDVVLARCPHPVVVFIDEVDSVQSLPTSFTDEFFGAIRSCFTERAHDSRWQRLTFCLLGVATPSELIKNPLMTPFNIGQRIVLNDFTLDEAKLFAQGMNREAAVAQVLLQRVMYWTNGQPYLTQLLCKKIAEDPSVIHPSGVDRWCEELFFAHRARETETNLQHIRTLLLQERSEENQAAVLDLYRQVRRRKRVKDSETNTLIHLLRLAGLVRVVDEYLWVRNRIYFRAFDEAWITANLPDAEQQRQRAAYRRGVMVTGAVASAIIAALGGGAYWYLKSYVWEDVTYCNAYAKRFGIMECVGRLTETQVERRMVSYKFIRRGQKNPVWKVQAVRGLSGELSNMEEQTFTDQLTTEHNVETYFGDEVQSKKPERKPVQWEFVLDSYGKIVYEKAYTKANELVWGLVYSPPLEGQPVHAHYVGDDGFPRPQSKSTAEFVEFVYSEQGDEVRTRYFDQKHKPQLGLDNAFIIERKFNAQGLPIEQSYFGVDGQPVVNKDGLHREIAKYNFLGNITEMIGFDVDDPSHSRIKATVVYDDYGSVIGFSVFDSNGQPTLYSNAGISAHKILILRDAYGNPVESSLFGTDGQPILHKDGYHKSTALFDARGNGIEGAFFGTDGQPILLNGVHKWTAQFDPQGHEIERAFFGTDGQPILHKDGYHKSTALFDARGNGIEGAFFGTGGQPILHKEGVHKWVRLYDERGNEIENSFFGTDEQPILNRDGYHKWVRLYDERGNEIENSFFGTDGQSILHKEGVHKWTAQFDPQGHEIERAFFGTDGQPILHRDGYHTWVRLYNEQGKEIEGAFFGTDGQPVLSKEGLHKWTFQFDAQGNEIERAFFGTDGQPILHRDGYHKWVRLYDERGKEVENSFFGTDGQPVLSKEGLHKWTFQFDAQGNEIERAFFGTDGQPILHRDGYHKWVRLYNEQGKEIENSVFDTYGQPVLSKEGLHKWTFQFDTQGHEIERAFFGTEGQPILHKGCYCHKVKLEYDEQGRETNRLFFDIAGQQVDGKPKFSFSDIFAAMQPKQVVVVSILPNSQGEQLGIQPGDIFVEYDHVAIINTKLFITKRDFEPKDGTPRELKVLRNGKELTFQIKPGKIGAELKDEPL